MIVAGDGAPERHPEKAAQDRNNYLITQEQNAYLCGLESRPFSMPGLYLHIPFCRRKCAYCDFFSQARLSLKEPFVQALIREMEQESAALPTSWDALSYQPTPGASGLPDRKAADLPQKPPLETVYFGGGTPSLLEAGDFCRIFQAIARCFDVSRCREITFEANPDDLDDAYLKSLAEVPADLPGLSDFGDVPERVFPGLPFNRISIGCQSFVDGELQAVGRRHSARQAAEAVGRCREAGFRNISLDLMYGLPGQTIESFAHSLRTALELEVQHLSAYMLSLEPQVPLARSLARGSWQECDDQTAEKMFLLLCHEAEKAGFEHYEISNFALDGRRSRHNSAYWKGVAYLGLGPGAHSYFPQAHRRRWNAPDLKGYVDGRCAQEQEQLSLTDQYNELIMTRLRTRDGLLLDEVKELDREGRFYRHLTAQAMPYLKDGKLALTEDARMILASEALFVSDSILSDLFITDGPEPIR